MIRKAVESDIGSIHAIDTIAQRDRAREDFIRRSVADGNCWVLVASDSKSTAEVAGYGVLNYSFYDCGLIDMLMVRPDRRRHGYGSELIRHMELECRTEKLFTSTNESNAPMQALLAKLGYQPSGIIYNLDDGDPELVYFKQLR